MQSVLSLIAGEPIGHRTGGRRHRRRHLPRRRLDRRRSHNRRTPGDEQSENAQSFERQGRGRYLPQPDLERGALTPMLLDSLQATALPAAARASATLGGAGAVAAFVTALVPPVGFDRFDRMAGMG